MITLDWNHFTPIKSLAGGMLIGLAASLLILLNGRIAGISGILGGLFTQKPKEIGWRLFFLGGLISAPFLYSLFTPLNTVHLNTHPALLSLAGLLVGFGTRYASGCTSGHGVCGLSRLSPRSLVATLIFMSVGFLTVFITHYFFQTS